MADIGAIIERQRVLHNLHRSLSNTNDFAYNKYHTIEEIHAWIDQMVATYPELVTPLTIGKSYENRNIKGFKISSKKMATKIDGTKATTKKAVWWDGDRLWRKTRSKTSVPFCYGADPNRNWDHHWCERGASSDPCSDLFCGEKAFSEIEIAQVAKFIASQRDTIVNYINFHAYSQMWMSPWGYTTMRPAQFKLQDDGSIQAITALTAVHSTKYLHGSVAETIYLSSGSTADWAYGIANITFSYGVELRDTGEYGFLLPEDQIIPTGEETFAGLLALLQYIEKYVYA
ncbi:unnamed protein product [Rotaria sordida]|uniref:Peptidase M14 domain-containing protein n=1 Tax=Rotaria sordida TaxID=392033 RepID=A0A819U2N2_9BILA|nr:unnamed protein product [Rotaria sordida]